ncbi:unnamed protein product [Rotaria sp. Silwood2]|nr:unnamed protein product [Rotaria sp. Silwood2]
MISVVNLEQPLDFHYNRLMPTIITSEYETGDQIRLANDIKLTRTEFGRTISETEAAYMKILESSQTLLNVLKRESHSLHTKIDE